MINTLTFNQTITEFQQIVEQARDYSAEGKSITKAHSRLSRISKKISRLKRELDFSFPEFSDLQETLASYNLYQQLVTLEQQIKTLRGVVGHD
jgi:hypothetical protein